MLLPTSELHEMHRLKAALAQYPRMAFVVVTEATADSDGGLGKLAALHEEPQGMTQLLLLLLLCTADLHSMCLVTLMHVLPLEAQTHCGEIDQRSALRDRDLLPGGQGN